LELVGSSLTPGVYQRIYRTDGGYREHFAGTFTFHPGHGHLHFDNWLNFHLRAVLPSNGVGNIVVSGDKTSFAIIDLEIYDPARARPTPFYNGGLIQGMSVGWGDVYGASLPDQWIDVTGVPSGLYWLEAVVDPENHVVEENESNNVARILIYLDMSTSAPNDNFANAIVLTGASASVPGSNANATKEPGEPQHRPGNPGGASVWYRWTAPSNMNVVVSTEGSSFDTVLGVYTGSAVAGLLTVAQNDDADPEHRHSRVAFAAIANTTYRIAVDGFNAAEGSIELNLNPAWNNDLSQSIQLSGYSGSTSGSTRGATRQAGEPPHAGVNGTNSIWYVWTAPTNGPFTFDTLGSGFDTLLAVYTGAAFPLTAVAGNDNVGPSNTASRVTFEAVSGTTYRIAVDGFPGQLSAGIVKLSWHGPMPPIILSQPTHTNQVAGGVARFIVAADGTGPLHYQWRHAGTNLIDDDGHISGANSAALTIGKILVTDAGPYSVVVTNAWGAVTSATVNLIVLDNPRVVYINHHTAPVGGVATVPLNMQAVGDERTFKFSLAFDPAALASPRVTNGANTANATVVVNESMLGSGRLGVTLTLPPGQTLPASSTLEIAQVKFDVNGSVAHGTESVVGFDNQPIPRSVLSTNDAPLVALFAAGSVTLENQISTASGQFLPDGSFQLSLTGAPNQRYVIEATTNLTAQTWEPLATNQTSLSGLLQFLDSNATNTPHRFFRARMAR
jgi:hypothetical protein